MPPGRRKPPEKLNESALFDYAVRTLSARSCSSDELRFKLRPRAQRLADIDSVISRLKDLHYLDDRRFSEMYAAVRVENQGFGRARVLHDLRARRVAPKLAERAVAKALDGRDEMQMVAEFIERRMREIALKGLDDDRKLASAFRKLRRAGFSTGPVLAVLKRYAGGREVPDEIAEGNEDDEQPSA